MARVQVAHQGLNSPDATTAPRREPVPAGKYAALIMSASHGGTRHTPPLSKLSVEFQILHSVDDKNEQQESEHNGRRVYQDYILEPDPSMPDLNEQRRYELRMLLEATNAEFDDTGFDTDDLLNKTVFITVAHRKGKTPDDDGNYPTFTNVKKTESTEKVDESDLV